MKNLKNMVFKLTLATILVLQQVLLQHSVLNLNAKFTLIQLCKIKFSFHSIYWDKFINNKTTIQCFRYSDTSLLIVSRPMLNAPVITCIRMTKPKDTAAKCCNCRVITLLTFPNVACLKFLEKRASSQIPKKFGISHRFANSPADTPDLNREDFHNLMLNQNYNAPSLAAATPDSSRRDIYSAVVKNMVSRTLLVDNSVISDDDIVAPTPRSPAIHVSRASARS